MTIGVIIGLLLLLLLIGLVVLQGMIEWGNFDTDAFFRKKDDAGKKPAKAEKTAKKASKNTAKKAKERK